MEALTAVSVACLTIYDMVKAAERGMRIEGIRLVEKRGGKSGRLSREGALTMALLSGRRCARPRARRRRAAARRSACRSPRPTAACSPTDLAALRTQPPARCLRDGRLRGARRRCRDRAGDAQADRRGRGRAPVRRHGRAGRDRAHLHRRRAAGRHRHGGDPGEHRARGRRHRGRAPLRRAGATSASPGSTSRKATSACARAAASPAATSRSPPR